MTAHASSRGWLLAASLALAALPASGGDLSAQPRGRGDSGAEFGWFGDYAQARALARQSGKPLMVVFRCVP